MFDNRPIGVFDSGLGGLTVAKEIERTLPNESIVYLGDTARVPYGNRSAETITQFSRDIVEHLLKQNVKAIVIACASATSAAASILREEYPHIPIFDVIQPFRVLDLNLKNATVGVIGTRATINSGKLSRAIVSHYPDAVIHTQACPLFVPIIEEGITSGPLIESTITMYLSSWKDKPLDYLVLGCTHYPLLTNTLKQHFPHTSIINPGVLLATELQQLLSQQNLNHDPEISPTYTYEATDLNPSFQTMAEFFLEKSITVTRVDL